jgi:hypothetical protein
VGVKTIRAFSIVVSAIAVAASIPASAFGFTESFDEATGTTTVTFTQSDADEQLSPNTRKPVVYVEVGGGIEKYVRACDDCKWRTGMRAHSSSQ